MVFENFVTRLILLGTIATILVGCGRSTIPETRGNGRPNIVLILADDMGYSDIGCYGSEIRTPNIDALAEDGMLFTQFYNAGRCCPSRASLLTGMYSHKTGIGHMVAPLKHPSYQGYLNDACLTIAEALKPAGYASYMTGKWHVGTKKDHWPLQRGFDKFYGSNTSQGHYFKVYEGRKLLYGNEEVSTPSEWYATDAFTDSAISFIKHHQIERKDAPFFLYIAYTAPHWPIHALPEDIEEYEGAYAGGYDSVRRERLERMKKLSLIDKSWQLSPLDDRVPAWSSVDQKKEARKMEVYAAMVHRMDQGVGKVLEAIDRMGLEDNTMVVFLSDNGGSAEEIHRSEPGSVIGEYSSYTSIGLPWANVNNTPFRKYKAWTDEGGISTPLIIKYPQLIKEAAKTDEVGHIIDLMPTFLELAGVDYPDQTQNGKLLPMDGKSLTPVLRSGRREAPEALFWEHEGRRAVRKGEWKLVSSYGGRWELYNMKEDRTEMEDLSKKYPDRVADLSALYESWARKNGVLPWDEVKSLQTTN